MSQLRDKLKFQKAQRLCSITDIDALFKSDTAFLVYPLRCVWKVIEHDQFDDKPTSKVLISVPKRNHKLAVTRNLLKRRMREAYRLNTSPCLNPNINLDSTKNNYTQPSDTLLPTLHISFTYIAKEILEYSLIEKAIKDSLEKIIKKNTHLAPPDPH